jgi:hypothetical protein
MIGFDNGWCGSGLRLMIVEQQHDIVVQCFLIFLYGQGVVTLLINDLRSDGS